MEKQYKTVLYPITVPKGDFCWDYNPPYSICEHFGNEGGHSHCEMGFHGQIRNENGVVKAPKCLSLAELQENEEK